MKRCVRCSTPRTEESFYTDGSHPADICKPCIFRPNRIPVRKLRAAAESSERTQAAVRYVVKKAQADGHPFVYLVSAKLHRFKIGYSTNVNTRIRQLETASSEPVQLIAVAPGGRPLEKDLHYEFRGLRVRLEWFKDNQHLIVRRFSTLSGSMVFLPSYVSSEAPQTSDTVVSAAT
jgi:hypothetical protein